MRRFIAIPKKGAKTDWGHYQLRRDGLDRYLDHINHFGKVIKSTKL